MIELAAAVFVSVFKAETTRTGEIVPIEGTKAKARLNARKAA